MIGSKVAYFLVGRREGWGPCRAFKGVPLLIYFLQLGPPPKGVTTFYNTTTIWRPKTQTHEPMRDNHIQIILRL